MKQVASAGVGLLAALLGCAQRPEAAGGAAPPDGYDYAFVMPDCAPWDAMALTLYLTTVPVDAEPVPPPFLRVSVYSSPGSVPGRRFRWSDSSNQVAAGSRCSAGGCTTATAGQVSFGRLMRDSSLQGELELKFPDGARERGGFRAAWRGRPALCG